MIEGAHVVPGFFDIEAHGSHPRGTIRYRGRRRGATPDRTSPLARTPSRPPGRPVREGFDEHPAAPAVREDPGAGPRRAGDPQPQLRPDDRHGDRPGDGPGHGAGGRSPREPISDGHGRKDARMRLFLDTASIEEIREINRWGVLGGVTTNPSLVAKDRRRPRDVWKEILAEVHGDISLEVTELEADGMYEQGRQLASMAPNAVVKVPMTPTGLAAGKRLTRRDPDQRDPRVLAGTSDPGRRERGLLRVAVPRQAGRRGRGRHEAPADDLRDLRGAGLRRRRCWRHRSATRCTWWTPRSRARTSPRCRSTSSRSS